MSCTNCFKLPIYFCKDVVKEKLLVSIGES
jgi:hypothetical protein